MLKKIKYRIMLGIGSLCLFFLGCSKESFLIREAGSSTVVLEETVALEEGKEEKVETEVLASAYEKQPVEQLTKTEEIAIHVCGAVNQPGVYYLKEKQRVYEAIAKAGGFREDADRDYLNQALLLEDGMKITVPTKEETAGLRNQEAKVSEMIQKEEVKDRNQQLIQMAKESENQSQFIQRAEADTKETDSTEQGKIDLNTADEALLCTLPGIGQSRAQSIIAYRKEHGFFTNTEDVMLVSGIKEAAYEKIKDYITVSGIPGTN